MMEIELVQPVDPLHFQQLSYVDVLIFRHRSVLRWWQHLLEYV